MDEHTSVSITLEPIPGRAVVEVAGKRFIVDTEVATDFVQSTRGTSGWSHLGGWLVHVAGVVIGPQYDMDVPLTEIPHISAAEHAEYAELYDGLLHPPLI